MIPFRVGTFAVWIARRTLHDVELVGHVSSVTSHVIFARYLNRFDQHGTDHYAPFESKGSESFTGHIKRRGTGNKGHHNPDRRPYHNCPLLQGSLLSRWLDSMRKRFEALRQPQILGIVNRTVDDRGDSALQRVDKDGTQL